jgi:transcriptional regulator with XRE-family HTH domain
MESSSKLRDERLRHGWSQTNVSMRTGIAQSDISALERGKRYAPPGWRRRLATAFKVPESELFPDEVRLR